MHIFMYVSVVTETFRLSLGRYLVAGGERPMIGDRCVYLNLQAPDPDSGLRFEWKSVLAWSLFPSIMNESSSN